MVCTAGSSAQEPPPPIREIFVPFDDLNVILDAHVERVFLTRLEYEKLLRQAKTSPAKNVPLKMALLSSKFTGTLEDGRALLSGTLQVEVLDVGLHGLPLDLNGVGIRSATIDDKPASLGRDDQGRITLFVEGKGLHDLKLELTAPLQTAAAQQTLAFTLPIAGSSSLTLDVPGNVEVKGGAAVQSRTYDEAKNVTTLEILPQRGQVSIVMSLNNRLLREQRVVIARSVLVDEVTQGYERLHANVSHRVLHGAVDKFRFRTPAGFEVTRVDSPRIARWEMQAGADGEQVLEVVLREPTNETVVLEISANRSPQPGQDWLAELAKWKLPKLEPLDVAGHVAVVGLLVEDRLQPQRLEPTGLLPIDAGILASALPESVFRAEPGAPTIHQAATFYAPQGDYALSAEIIKLPAGLGVRSNSLLILSEGEQSLQGGFVLSPDAEDLFRFKAVAPANWRVTEWRGPDGQPLLFERYALPDGRTRLVVQLRQPIAAGQSATVSFAAVSTPPGWLGDWSSKTVEFPHLIVEETARDAGAIAVQTLDDLAVRPEQLDNLTPLLDAEKSSYGMAQLPTALAYRYEARPFAMTLAIERTAPSLAAEIYNFLQVQPDHVKAHYELRYSVREAAVRKVMFSLPASTPAEIAIRGLGATVVKETLSRVEGERRIWTVKLAERQLGEVRLAVDFQLPLSGDTQKAFALPLVRADEVDYQSAFVAVEGDPQLQVEVVASPRKVDVGELAAAEYQVGRRVIGAFGYVGDSAELKVDIAPRQPYALPAAIVQKAQLVTQVSAGGRYQSVVRYDLLTKATLLQIELPENAQLWTILLDHVPTKPQRDGDRLLLSLPPRSAAELRSVQLLYETAGTPLHLSGEVAAQAPRLLLAATQEGAAEDATSGDVRFEEVPQADLEWQLVLPTGYRVKRFGDSVATDELPRHTPAIIYVAAALYELAGGIDPFYRNTYREAAMTTGGQQYGKASSSYFEGLRSYSAPKADVTREDAHAFRNSGDRFDPSLTPPTSGPQVFDAEQGEVRDLPAPLAMDEVLPPAEPPAPPPAAAPPAMDFDAAPQAPADPFGDPTPPAAETPGPTVPVPAPVAPQAAAAAPPQTWALEGFNTLPIELQPQSDLPKTTFRSLGEDPRLHSAVVDDRRVHAAAWGFGLLVLLVGVGLTRRRAKTKLWYLAAVLLGGTLPLFLTSMLDGIAPVLDAVFIAGCILVFYYPIAAAVLGVARLARLIFVAEARPTVAAPTGATTAVALLIAASLIFAANSASAQAPAPEVVEPPVQVPADAIIIPFEADKANGMENAERVLVPYAQYVELWNRAHPDKRLTTAPPPTNYALAGGKYEATLAGGDELLVEGTLQLDVFTDETVTVSLPLVGGVLGRAMLDGKPARVHIVQAAGVAGAPQQAVAGAPPVDLSQPAVINIFASGKGRKELRLSVRLGLERRGGWRIARGTLPSAPATELTLTVPQEKTEVRLVGLPDRPRLETTAADEKIETSLAAGGGFEVHWRPRVSEGQVDRNLTAKSVATFDVREDALRLVWETKLEFGRGTRDAFTLRVPKDYLVEQVLGENIRGWVLAEDDDKQKIEVTLLKPALGTETLSVYLSRRGEIGHGDLQKFEVPSVLVAGAALQQGDIAIRRSPRLDVRTESAVQAARSDATDRTQLVAQAADATDAAVLNVKPFQTYRFTSDAFRITLSAQPVTTKALAEVQAAVRVADRETTLDANLVINPGLLPVYQVRAYLPDNFTLERVAPERQWAVTKEGDRTLLTVYLLDGREHSFSVSFFGRFGARDKKDELPAPRIEVLDVERQQGQIVVLPDPDTDVQPKDLRNTEVLPSASTTAWLAGEQRQLAKTALQIRSGDYSATFMLIPRRARVTSRTITNVKVTQRAIEETILVDFQVEGAGIHEVSLLLPEYLRSARVKAQLLKRKIVEPATDAAGKPLPGLVRLRLQLQDDVLGSFAVVIEHDRVLSTQKQQAAIPQIETGTTSRRFVAIENLGRDEVIIEPVAGLQALSRQQEMWQELSRYLGDHITQGYLVAEGAAAPQLTFHTQQREQATKTDARIRLSQTLLIVDGYGAYRGKQEYRIENETEQFLVVELPEGAQLWTAVVAGEPVKPAAAEPPQAGVVRIPLVKTAIGEGDYLVELKYAGRMPKPSNFAQVRFPLMHTQNINVEQSQVRLLLPETRTWFNFGGSLRLVQDQSELAAGFQTYLNKRITEASQMLSSDNPYTQVRAANNLKSARGLLEATKSGPATLYDDSKSSQLSLQNDTLLKEAEEQIDGQLAEQTAAPEATDNRMRLNGVLLGQSLARSKNVVSQLGSNFDQKLAPLDGEQKKGDKFNPGWLSQNSLSTRDYSAPVDQAEAAGAQPKPGKKSMGSRVTNNGRNSRADDAISQSGAQANGQAAPDLSGLVKGEELAKLRAKDQEQGQAAQQQLGDLQQAGEKLGRYQRQLERNSNEAPQQQLYGYTENGDGLPAINAPMGGSGGGLGGFGNGGPQMPQASSSAAPGMAPVVGQPTLPFDDRTPIAGQPLDLFVEGESLDYGVVPAGLASLQVALPERGRMYSFMTVRGELVITANSTSNALLGRLIGLTAVLVIVLLVAFVVRLGVWRRLRDASQQRTIAVLLMVLGVLSIISGVLPVAGFATLIIGAGLLIWSFVVRRFLLLSTGAAI